MKKINILLIVLIFSVWAYGGYVAPEKEAMPNQPIEIKVIEKEPNIYYEICKWGGGAVTLVAVTWLGWWLNNKSKRND